MQHRAILPLLLLPGLSQTDAAGVKTEARSVPRLSRSEMAAGWILLFNGKTPEGWRGYRKKRFPVAGWVIESEALHHLEGGGGGDIVTERRFHNFELKLEWKVARGANSGIIYRASEEAQRSYMTGPEYQILDDAADQPDSKTSAGSLYGLYAPRDKKLKAGGSYNTARILVRGNHVEHWLNGKRILEATIGSEDWNERVEASKFGKWKGFGRVTHGHICLQDHGDEVWYRNLKLRELPPTGARRGDTILLLNGKNLDGWSAFLKGDARLEDVWSVTGDGVLLCKGMPKGYLYTRKEYLNFILELEWRFAPGKAGNSGVLLRMQPPHKVWPKSIEAQLQSGNAGDFWNIGTFPMQVDRRRTSGRNTKKTHPNEKPVGGWNRYEIIVDGGWVSLRVNGQVLNEAWNCAELSGPIGLQSEGAEIQFRKIHLTPLR
ncbi:MAG: DUF1080 domain-containing protein [Planctomycetota bacterium]